MNEYIEREYLVDHIHACMENDRLMKTATKEEILQMVADAPSADVQPVVHGKWVLSDNQRREDVDNGNYLYFCSQCLRSDLHAKSVTVSYCWNCGAKMDGEGADNVSDQ